jgi:GNAT superfamily N-acetyltransferase
MTAAIRKATRDDLQAILGLYADLEPDDGQVLDLPEAERILERMAQYPDYSVYVAEVEDKVVGTFGLLIMDNLAHLGAPSGVVEDVVVNGRWRGRGIGKEMMRFAMDRCTRAGCYKLTLSSNLQRKRAHDFYESLGFERHGYSYLVKMD